MKIIEPTTNIRNKNLTDTSLTGKTSNLANDFCLMSLHELTISPCNIIA